MSFDHEWTTRKENLIISFFALSCLFGWSLFIAAAFGVDIEPDGMPLGPVLAAAVVCLLGGKEMRRSWWSSLKNIKTGISWYIAALLLPIVVILCSVGINHLFGAPMPGRDQLIPTINLSLYFIMFAFVGLAKKPGGLHS